MELEDRSLEGVDAYGLFQHLYGILCNQLPEPASVRVPGDKDEAPGQALIAEAHLPVHINA